MFRNLVSVHEVNCLFLLKEMDSVLKALMQAWEKTQQLKISLVSHLD